MYRSNTCALSLFVLTTVVYVYSHLQITTTHIEFIIKFQVAHEADPGQDTADAKDDSVGLETGHRPGLILYAKQK